MMNKSKPKLIYIYDALCGWCFGFSGVMRNIFEQYKNQFDFEVISGGMVLGERQGPIAMSAELIKKHYPIIEETTGSKFGKAFLAMVEDGKQYQSSEKPAIALSVFKTYYPDKAVLFAHDLQEALFVEGLDLSINENYLFLVNQYDIPDKDFLEKLKNEEFKQLAYYDFALTKQLQVTGFPAAFIQTSENSFYMIAKGYADLNTMELRISNVLTEIAKT